MFAGIIQHTARAMANLSPKGHVGPYGRAKCMVGCAGGCRIPAGAAREGEGRQSAHASLSAAKALGFSSLLLSLQQPRIG
jgi:hypothetical protein